MSLKKQAIYSEILKYGLFCSNAGRKLWKRNMIILFGTVP